jgi:SEC-C motif-containing protein
MLCPCKSGKLYEQCCKPFHTKVQLPSLPLELMRSRYSAFVLGAIDYLIFSDTTSTQSDYEALESFAKGVEWIGLEIVNAYDDTVEFKAYYNLPSSTELLHEKSRFVKVDGVWKYESGEILPSKIERNIPCPCGSGKKFKRCHLR